MKVFSIALFIGLCACINLTAQYGGGRYGGGRNGYGGGYGNGYGNAGMSRPQQSYKYNKDIPVNIVNFPEIEGMTLNQHMDVATAVTNEHKEFIKLANQKQELLAQIEREENPKDIDKKMKKVTKIDEKITKLNMKTDKKIQTILPPEIYQLFQEKKHEIKFSDSQHFNPGGDRPQNDHPGSPEGQPPHKHPQN